MKNCCIPITLVLCLLGSASAFNVLVDGYSLENYGQYDSATASRRMVFDDSGNLYINHYEDGKIMKVNGDGQASTLVSGLDSLCDITWGGGTGYGNYLYSIKRRDGWKSKIMKINLNGSSTIFADMDPPKHGVTALAIDRTGNYGGNMFVGTGSKDKIYRINTSGAVSLFADWPGWTDGGGPYGIGFDLSGKYDNKMYIATSFKYDPHLSGLFALNPNGSAYRFCDDLVSAHGVGFDTVGRYFDGDMFVLGRTSYDVSNTLWRVYADGSSEEFMTGVGSFAFGDDGAMYVSGYSPSADEVTIARVAPVMTVLLDIKPQLCPNPVNVKSKGVLQVAILGSDEFDVTDIDAASLNILGVQPIRSAYRDAATAVTDLDECDCITEGKDGTLDLLLRFDTHDLVKALGPVHHEDWIALTLEGFLSDGTPIEGTDCIVIQKKGKEKIAEQLR